MLLNIYKWLTFLIAKYTQVIGVKSFKSTSFCPSYRKRPYKSRSLYESIPSVQGLLNIQRNHFF